MWEVLVWLIVNIVLVGITPTYVGSTFYHHLKISYSEDHPHVCGKY